MFLGEAASPSGKPTESVRNEAKLTSERMMMIYQTSIFTVGVEDLLSAQFIIIGDDPTLCKWERS